VWSQHLAQSLDKIGDLKRRSSSDDTGARASYDEALRIFRELAAREPKSEEYRRRVAAGLVKIGDLQQKGDLAAAGKSYSEALEIYRSLAALYSILGSYRRDVSAILQKMAELSITAKDLENALTLYQERLKVDRESSESTYEYKTADYHDVSTDLGKIADIQSALGRAADAEKSYQEKLNLDQRLAKNDFENVELQRQIRRSLFHIADFQLGRGDVAAAQKSYADALAADMRGAEVTRWAFRKDQKSANRTNVIQAYIRIVWSALLAGKPQEAAEHAEIVIDADPSLTATNVNRAHAYLLLGRYDEAKAIYLATKDIRKGDTNETYADDIRDDFEQLSKLGLATPDFARMTKELGL
jgi:tetratricopeptide (TPR) repeat protein